MPVIMRRLLTAIFAIAVVFFLFPQDIMAEDWDLDEKPWEKFGANLGLFVSNIESSFRIGSGIGLDINVEELLGLESTNSAFRADILWRFSKNRRHRLDFGWFSFRRSGDRAFLQDITIEHPITGEEITIDAGTQVKGFFNFDIYQLNYSYSFLQDERIDLAALFGLYIMPIDVGISAAGFVDKEGTAKFTAPLPALGLRMDFALTPRWFLRSKTQLFYMEFENFKGSLLAFSAALEYNPWKHFGIGLGIDSFVVNVDAKGEDWPLIDFVGNISFGYTGFQLYLRYFF